MTLENRVAIISGATGVTGKLAAMRLAEGGAALALLGTDQTRLNQLALELNLPEERILTHVADLTVADAVTRAAAAVEAKFGRADILLHLVGGWTGGKSLIETPREDLQNMLNQHLWTSFHLTQAFLPALIRNGWGRVIVVSSPKAVKPTTNTGAYTIAKAAQENLILTIAEEAAANGVTANILQVNAIDAQNTGKGTSPETLVKTILTLCDENAAFTNGARIPLF